MPDSWIDWIDKIVRGRLERTGKKTMQIDVDPSTFAAISCDYIPMAEWSEHKIGTIMDRLRVRTSLGPVVITRINPHYHTEG